MSVIPTEYSEECYETDKMRLLVCLWVEVTVLMEAVVWRLGWELLPEIGNKYVYKTTYLPTFTNLLKPQVKVINKINLVVL